MLGEKLINIAREAQRAAAFGCSLFNTAEVLFSLRDSDRADRRHHLLKE